MNFGRISRLWIRERCPVCQGRIATWNGHRRCSKCGQFDVPQTGAPPPLLPPRFRAALKKYFVPIALGVIVVVLIGLAFSSDDPILRIRIRPAP